MTKSSYDSPNTKTWQAKDAFSTTESKLILLSGCYKYRCARHATIDNLIS
mgnify:CR=1 FL=1